MPWNINLIQYNQQYCSQYPIKRLAHLRATVQGEQWMCYCKTLYRTWVVSTWAPRLDVSNKTTLFLVLLWVCLSVAAEGQTHAVVISIDELSPDHMHDSVYFVSSQLAEAGSVCSITSYIPLPFRSLFRALGRNDNVELSSHVNRLRSAVSPAFAREWSGRAAAVHVHPPALL